MRKKDGKYNSMDNQLNQDEKELFGRVERAVKEDGLIQFEKKVKQTFYAKRSNSQLIAKIAAVCIALVCLSALAYYSVPVHKRLFNSYYQPYEDQTLKDSYRGNEHGEENAYKLYASKNYEKASTILLETTKAKPSDFEARFLLAISFIELKKYQEAEMHLQILLDAPLNFYTDDALWYQALLHVRKKEFPLAKKLASSIGTSSVYYGASQKLLQKIGSNQQ